VFFVLLRRGAVSQVASLFFLMPPVTAVIDYLVLGDALTPYKVAGLALAASGVYLATRPQPAVGVRPAVRVRRAGGAMPAAISAMTAPGGRRNLSVPPPTAPRSCPAPCE
jgi:drug/metabolite transporter (DMT)-like permease